MDMLVSGCLLGAHDASYHHYGFMEVMFSLCLDESYVDTGITSTISSVEITTNPKLTSSTFYFGLMNTQDNHGVDWK